MSRFFIKDSKPFGIPEKFHNFVFSFSWSQTVWKENIQMFPLILNQFHYMLFQPFTHICQEMRARRYRVLLEYLFILNLYFGQKFSKLLFLLACLESSVSWLINFGSRCYSIKCDIYHLFRVHFFDNRQQIFINSIKNIFLGQWVELVF